jgi:hypothetical protein
MYKEKVNKKVEGQRHRKVREKRETKRSKYNREGRESVCERGK